MDCTQEQYEKYLKEELKKIGYNCNAVGWSKTDKIIANNGGVGEGSIISSIVECKDCNYRTYLGKFNADLFLALAAMTDKTDGGYGEWWICKESDDGCFTKDCLYRAVAAVNHMFAIIDDNGKQEGYCGSNHDHFRKATVSEIMAKFGEQPQKSVLSFDVTFDATEVSKRLDKITKDLEMTVRGVMLSAYLNKVEKDVREILGIEERMVYRLRRFEPPVVGELAIFWQTGRKSKAVIGRLIARANDSYVFYESGTERDKQQYCFDYAILFESIEQYNEFIKY